MTPVHFIEKNVISELMKLGFDVDIAHIGAREAVNYYHRSSPASGKSKMFDDCLSIAKAWATKCQGKKKSESHFHNGFYHSVHLRVHPMMNPPAKNR